MKYIELANLYQQLESTTKRLEKTKYIEEFLKKVPNEDLSNIILLLQGRVFPVWDETKIGVSSQLTIKALSAVSGAKSDDIVKKWKELGDLGLVAEKLMHKKSQATLFSSELTVNKVLKNIQKLAVQTGAGSIDIKVKLISELLGNSQPIEAKYIIRTLLEDIRAGIGPGTIRDAIVWAYMPKIVGIFFKCTKCKFWNPNTDKCLNCGADIENKYEKEVMRFDIKEKVLRINEVSQLEKKEVMDYNYILAIDEKVAREVYNFFLEKIEEANDISNDFGIVARTLKEQGFFGLDKIALGVGKPFKVMLYQKAKSIKDAFERVGAPCAIEYKYDGIRMQIHKDKKKITLFTRRLENVTAQFPEVKEYVEKYVHCESCILEAEAIGFDQKTKKYLPFQNISQRVKRKHDIEELAQKMPVEINCFDIVLIDGRNLMKTPFQERRKILTKIIDDKPYKIQCSRIMISKDEKEIESFYHEALDNGQEGIMLKNLNSIYKPGSRVGFGLKLKPTMDPLDLVIIGAEWGQGKRSGWLTSFDVACVNEYGELFEIGKVSTGLKEKSEEGVSFDIMTQLLAPLIQKEEGKKVKVKPQIVIEVLYEEIQKSPSYSSGYALRFPRFVRLRDTDKPLEDCSTLEEIEELYKEQQK